MGGFTTLVGVFVPPAGGFVPPAGGLVPPAGGLVPPAGGLVPPAGGFVPPAGVFVPPAVVEPEEPVLTTVGLPVILSMISLVPAPSAAPVSAFVIVLVVEFLLVVGVFTVGFTTDVGDVVLVVGVVVVLFVIVGLTVGLTAGVVTFGKVVLDVSDGLVVKGTFGASVVFGTVLVFVVKDAGGLVGSVGFGVVGAVVGLVTVEVIGEVVEPLPVVMAGRAPPPLGFPPEVIEPDSRPVKEGRSLKLRMTLSNGARSSPLA